MASHGPPEPQPETARRLYNVRAAVYEDSWHPSFAQYMVDTASLKPGERVLDLACGTGLATFAAALAVGSSGSVIGVDVSDGMLAEAKSRLEKEKERFQNVQFFNHDIADLGSLDVAKKESFDVVMCVSAFVLLRDPRKALKQWINYLKPGGRLVVDVTNPRVQLSGICWEKVHNRLGVQSPSLRLWVKSEDSLKDILREAGFDISNSKFAFKEQVGYGRRYRSIDEAESEASKGFNKFNKPLRDLGLMDKANALFVQEWASLADSSGKLLEVDGVYVAVAQKP